MSHDREILFLIPARGGSKGIPRKNVRTLCGKPLIGYTIEAALETNLGRVVVSTDDSQSAAVSRDFDADVPFERPARLASDTAGTLDVVLHAVDELFESRQACWVCILQPTSPLRTASDIVDAVELCRSHQRPVVSVCRARKPLSWYYHLDEEQCLYSATAGAATTRRQGASAQYLPNGAIYLVDPSVLRPDNPDLLTGSRGYVMPFERSVDIDDEFDWLLAEAIITDTLSGIRRKLFVGSSGQN